MPLKKCPHYAVCISSEPMCDDPNCSINQKKSMKSAIITPKK
jgi:hypothetical protein